MIGVPETRESLLIRLRDAEDHEAWSEFATIYRPAIYRMARRRGLQDADAQDLAQRVLVSVSQSIANWQPTQGPDDKNTVAGDERQRGARFRTWLYTVARNAVTDHFRRARPDVPIGGTDGFHDASAMDAADSDLELQSELRRSMFRFAAQIIQAEFESTTWAAFWRTAVGGQTVAEVARQLDKSVGAVYIARSRVMKRLREEVEKRELNE